MSRQAMRALIDTLGVDAEGANGKLETVAEGLHAKLCSMSLPKALAKQPTAQEAICLHLACERLDIKFNLKGAVRRSAVTEKVYDECLAEARMLFSQPANVNFHTLSIAFGCAPAEAPAATVLEMCLDCIGRESVNYPAVYAAVFILVCKELKVAGIKRAAVQKHASVTDATLKATIKQLEALFYHKISQICGQCPLTASRKRLREADDHVLKDHNENSSGRRPRKASEATPQRQLERPGGVYVVIDTSRRSAAASADGSKRQPLHVAGLKPPEELLDKLESHQKSEKTGEAQQTIVPGLENCGPKPISTMMAPIRASMTPMISAIPYRETKKYNDYLKWRVAVLARLRTKSKDKD